MKVYNTFSGLGYNTFLWDRNIHDITSIEYNEHISKNYELNFPKDTILTEDALNYVEKLLNNKVYLEANRGKTLFFWNSPPCQSHTMFRMIRGHNIPDMKSLYGLMTLGIRQATRAVNDGLHYIQGNYAAKKQEKSQDESIIKYRVKEYKGILDA